MKDSRSATKPPRSVAKTISDEMSRVLSENRYGGGAATKADLLKLIADWRSRLLEANP